MTSITTNVRENVMLFNFYLTHGQKVYLIQAKKISFVEMGKNAEYSYLGCKKSVARITSHTPNDQKYTKGL